MQRDETIERARATHDDKTRATALYRTRRSHYWCGTTTSYHDARFALGGAQHLRIKLISWCSTLQRMQLQRQPKLPRHLPLLHLPPPRPFTWGPEGKWVGPLKMGSGCMGVYHVEGWCCQVRGKRAW